MIRSREPLGHLRNPQDGHGLRNPVGRCPASDLGGQFLVCECILKHMPALPSRIVQLLPSWSFSKCETADHHRSLGLAQCTWKWVSQCALTEKLSATYKYSISWKLYRRFKRNGWFRCSSIRRSRIIFRTLSERTTGQISDIRNMIGHSAHAPSSFRIYLSAKVRPVSLRSTMRTLPKAPLPTTLSNLK